MYTNYKNSSVTQFRIKKCNISARIEILFSLEPPLHRAAVSYVPNKKGVRNSGVAMRESDKMTKEHNNKGS